MDKAKAIIISLTAEAKASGVTDPPRIERFLVGALAEKLVQAEAACEHALSMYEDFYGKQPYGPLYNKLTTVVKK
jgi:hypothetical protein